MRDATLGRVMWKEYRLQRDFWLVIAALIVVLQFSVIVGASFSDRPNAGAPPHVLFMIGLGVPAIFALGSGAILFAGEREAETYDFQRALPVAAGRLVAGKMLSGLAGAILLFLFGALSAWLLTLVAPTAHVPPPTYLTGGLMWAGSILAVFEVFAWAVLFSLLLGRVLWATVLGAVAAAFFGVFAAQQLVAGVLYLFANMTQPDYFVESMPLRALAALLLLAIDVALARRWMAPDPIRRFPVLGLSPETADSVQAVGWPMRSTMLLHLVWQASRQMWVTLLMILGSMALVALWMYFTLTLRSGRESFSHPLIILGPALAVLIGSTVFWADQQRAMHQYFAERGVSPRLVWFSRQCVAVAALAVWLVVASAAFAVESVTLGVLGRFGPLHTNQSWHATRLAELSVLFWHCLGLSLLSYCTAQACSLIARSGVIGLFFGIICSWLVGMWTLLMYSLGVPLWFSVVPLPVIFLWASWRRAPDWIEYRTIWRARGQLIASLAVPLLMIGVLVACYRVFEIPKVAVNLPLEQYQKPPTKEALQTAEMYEQASKSILALPPELWSDSTPAGESTVTESQRTALEAAVQQFVAASQREECWFPTSLELNTKADINIPLKRADDFWQVTINSGPWLVRPVLRTGMELQDAGRLEEAWQRYEAVLRFVAHLRRRGDWAQQGRANELEGLAFAAIVGWAAGPRQTPDRILAVLQLLESQYLGHLPSPSPILLNGYVHMRGMLDFKPAFWPDGWRTARIAAALLPWEYARARRIVNLRFHVEQQYYADVQQTLAAGKSIRHIWDRKWRLLDVGLSPSRWDSRADFVERLIDRNVVEHEESLMFPRETQCRALRLQLALLAHRAQHGELPSDLNQLVPNRLAKLPIDVYSGQDFIYRPQGLPYPIVNLPRPDKAVEVPTDSYDVLQPGIPFIASIGPYLDKPQWIDQSGEPAAKDLSLRITPDQAATPLRSEQELFHAAWCFPIPQGGLPEPR